MEAEGLVAERMEKQEVAEALVRVEVRADRLLREIVPVLLAMAMLAQTQEATVLKEGVEVVLAELPSPKYLLRAIISYGEGEEEGQGEGEGG